MNLNQFITPAVEIQFLATATQNTQPACIHHWLLHKIHFLATESVVQMPKIHKLYEYTIGYCTKYTSCRNTSLSYYYPKYTTCMNTLLLRSCKKPKSCMTTPPSYGCPKHTSCINTPLGCSCPKNNPCSCINMCQCIICA